MQRSHHADAAADDISPDAATFASLPLPLTQRVFLALPPDARGRASCVCRAWRDVLADPSLWTHLDLSGVFRAAGLLEQQRIVFSVLRGAAGRSRGLPYQMDLSQHRVLQTALLPVLTAYAGSLRELHLHEVHADDSGRVSVVPAVEAVLAAAPLLQVLTAEETRGMWDEARRMLRAEPPFAQLQMRGSLVVHFSREAHLAAGMERFGPFAAALADAALQPALSRLHISYLDVAQPAVLDALVDAALARRLRELVLKDCTPAAAAPLARLLAEGSLVVFEVGHRFAIRTLFDTAGAALIADALRMNTTLTTLKLFGADLCRDLRVAGEVLGALVGHPSLRELRITDGTLIMEHRSAFGAALGALIAADAPALHVLDCSRNTLYDDGLALIVEVLALNCHLRELDLGSNGMSAAFAREQLLPAVRANTSLRKLQCAGTHTGPAAVEAVELVRHRAYHG